MQNRDDSIIGIPDIPPILVNRTNNKKRNNYWLIPKNGRLLNALAIYTVVAERSIRQGSQRWEGTQSEGLLTWTMSSRLADEHFDSNWRVDELDTEELSGAEDETSSGFFSFELLLSSWVRNLDMFNFFFLSCFTSRKEQKAEPTAIRFTLMLTTKIAVWGRSLSIHANKVVQAFCHTTSLTNTSWYVHKLNLDGVFWTTR